ncbi:Nitrogen permease regulator 2 [Xylographa opegraphella]|nr:Nitrogen permease regulator 2 [Xylographa opegraphella]
MIKAIFFCKFDVLEGPKVVHQVPTHSITQSSETTSQPLVHFPSIAATVIPRQTFCSLPIALLHSRYRVLGYPTCLASPSYPRNEFIFNFCLVLPRHTEFTAYASVVAKLAALFKHLEETSHFLSQDNSLPNAGKIYALCEILLEDLNNYCECMISIDESNTLNIKLFPTYPPPPPIFPHQVPFSTVRFESLLDSNWDPTILFILPHIDGVNSVKQIAMLADVDYKLVRKALAHLLYYGCMILLDIFSFGASYAPTAEIGVFVGDTEVQAECRRYILLPDTSEQHEPAEGMAANSEALHGTKLVEMYCSLRQGLSVKGWCKEHTGVVQMIDVRRFMTFGVIKGFLYRVHKYPIATAATSILNQTGERKESKKGDRELKRLLDGNHCFDEICTELMISEQDLLGKLKGIGDVQIIQK